MRRVLRIGVIALLALAVVGNAGLLAGVVVTREPAPGPLSAQRIETASRPAVVFIQSNYKVDISVPEPVLNDAAKNALLARVEQMINAGEVTTLDQAKAAIVNLILSDPDGYLSPGTPQTDTFDQVATGSGFFVTQDGYLVTAAHVVSADKTEIRDEAVSETNDPAFIADFRKEISTEFSNEQLSISDAQIDSLVSFYQRWVAKYLSVDKVDVKYYLGTGKVQAGDNLTANGARASVVSIDPTKGGHDIAIMKADLTGVPTLQLAAGQPQLGQSTYAIGYPRQGYLAESVPLNQTVPETMTSGKVLLVAQQPSGWTAWGTSAQFTHGQSGGPVIDGKGNVLGIVSYSTLDAQGKQTLGGGFFVPSQYIAADLASQGIKPVSTPKDLTPTYYHALAEADIQRYKTELLLLEDIKAQSPFNAYVGDDISSTQSQILSGNDKTPPDFASYVPAASETSGGLIVAVLVLWLVMAVAGRRRRPVIVPVAAEPAAEAPPEVEAQAPVAPAPIPQPALEPATDVVSEPAAVLRESEPVAQTPADPPGD